MNIPVVIYHSIGQRNPHPWGHLSHPVKTFRKELVYLRRHGFSVIDLYTLHRHLATGEKLPPKPVVLTFDDGFLDNWVHMFQVIREFGMVATVFVSTDYIQPGEDLRPMLAPGESRSPLPGTEWLGYLNRAEIRTMSDSGSVSIQSHGVTHTWYFCGGEIVDFHHPGDDYPWLEWNVDPASKPYWLTRRTGEGMVPWGTPIYRFDKSLRCRRFFPDEEPGERCVRMVREEGGEIFFSRPDWKERLLGEIKDLVSDGPLDPMDKPIEDSPVPSPDPSATGQPGTGFYVKGKFESDSERRDRFMFELVESKRILEKMTGKPVDFIAWPGNGFCNLSHKLAIEEAGYKATAATGDLPNRSGQPPELITRHYYGNPFRNLDYDYLLYLQFVAHLNLHSGKKRYRLMTSATGRIRKILTGTGYGKLPGKWAGPEIQTGVEPA